MISKMINSFFPTSSQIVLSNGNFNHCASVVPCKKGVIVTWYSGSAECNDDQQVNVIQTDGKVTSEIYTKTNKKGNPIIWQEGSKTYLLYSMFEKQTPVPVHKWKYCSLWIEQIKQKGNKIIQIGETSQLSSPDDNLLARCNPITVDGKTILPLYNEKDRVPVLYSGSDGIYSKLSDIPLHDAIQPTIMIVGNKYKLLARCMDGTRQVKCVESVDLVNWKRKTSDLHNANNSISSMIYDNTNYIAWNDTPKGRSSLRFALVNNLCRVSREFIIDGFYGSYPNMCVDKRGKLWIVYTNHSKQIVLLSMSIAKMESLFRSYESSAVLHRKHDQVCK